MIASVGAVQGSMSHTLLSLLHYQYWSMLMMIHSWIGS